MPPTHSESTLVFFYLTHQIPTRGHKVLYEKGITQLQLSLPTNEQVILDWMITHPSFTRYIDSGLALLMKTSVLRKRFLLATAIVECEPAYMNRFLNAQKINFRFLNLIGLGIQTAFVIAIAFILFKLKRWK
jgi:hypothetical protein